MDQFPEMKGFYIIMDNAPTHTADEIDTEAFIFLCIHLSLIRSRILGPQWRVGGTDVLKMRVAKASKRDTAIYIQVH